MIMILSLRKSNFPQNVKKSVKHENAEYHCSEALESAFTCSKLTIKTPERRRRRLFSLLAGGRVFPCNQE